MDEAVVPDWNGGGHVDQVVPEFGVTSETGRKRAAVAHVLGEDDGVNVISKKIGVTLVNRVGSAPVPLAAGRDDKDSELRVRPRWETPRRRGYRIEPWQDAREFGTNPIDFSSRKRSCAVVRAVVARLVSSSVGLSPRTVEKWFNLLAEYLELNADEYLIVLCLLRKYLAAGGHLVIPNEVSRPQRWECVIAICCYMAVLLSEEFPSRAASDLKELLGPSFQFGKEQIAFLKVLDWNIEVPPRTFAWAYELAVNDTDGKAKIDDWLAANKPRPVYPEESHVVPTLPGSQPTLAFVDMPIGQIVPSAIHGK
uniref:Uncharacterized protein n=1 Tax=Compsopogon caeruleus TaxID=31354 RepID=A0A7S1TFI5_9RHOD|mmetsp:Transcript_3839/g.7365  ORF Transcript_3839/g.7365 Transcript_3839/m.7365 type:complete len:310 (+) Transcript_3839:197-1126(+)|eukprot:CAMPEP_0184682006 /NCGR_PEP_ID=MMETSP0312-20130426/5313_1 /TAXON_ID=31354 /ORGANISM="Compsopogon coeruleus, Strain SAG 36.94" /LENGTH=309 /DNA_ID=CAMNT_0027133229 /DNA_START=111 /DNA_END=1040 /DNA_ORIENTATION=+